MAGLIPRQFIDDILARTDIVELIDQRVPLKKAGKNYQACCPFHTEKSPSFTVSQDKQFYHCFGCGEHGNAISFIMAFDRVDFVDAIEELAAFHHLDVPREDSNLTPIQKQQQLQVYKQKQDDYELMEQISRFYRQQLKSAHDKDIAIDYLKNRGLSGEIAQRFGIGYIGEQWDSLMKSFASNSQSQQQLIELGMAIEGEKGRVYDRFRGRIMFPIRDKRGRVMGFGGRILAEGTPKYLNSPETRIYHKGNELYGLYEAKQANKNLTRIVVVEGYMDVVALAQHGVDYAVASLGTSTTTEQLQTLFRTVKEVICCYDGDKAGRDAAWRAMDNALPLIRDDVSIKFVFLPDGEDPDSLVRAQGQQAFETLLDEAKPLSKFLFEKLLADVDVNHLEGKAALISSFQPYLEKLPDSILKDAIVNELANNFGTGSELQLTRLNRQVAVHSSPKNPIKKTKTTPIRLAIALLLEHPSLANEVENVNGLQLIKVPGIDLLLQLIDLCQQHPNINSAQLIENFRDTAQGNQLAKLLCWDHFVSAEAAKSVFIDSLEKVITVFIEQRTEQLLQKARSGEINSQEKQELQSLLNNH